MRAHDQLDDAQTEPDAGGLTRQPLIDAIETPEDAALFLDRNADAVVFDVERDRRVAIAPRADEDPLVVGRVLQRVVEQIDQCGRQRIRICPHVGQVRRHVDPEIASVRQPVANRADGRRDDDGRTRRCEFETVAVALEAGEREEVLDQAAQARVLRRDQLEVLARLDGIERGVGEQAINEDAHRRERRPQLVRRGRDQIGFDSCHLEVPAQHASADEADRHNQRDTDRGH
jgi:hypothetical protein